MVAIELAYINTKHPDFSDAAQVSASVNSQQVVLLCLPSDLSDQACTPQLSGFLYFYAVLAVNSQGHFARTSVQNVVSKAAHDSVDLLNILLKLKCEFKFHFILPVGQIDNNTRKTTT